jgi:hypothetical protein
MGKLVFIVIALATLLIIYMTARNQSATMDPATAAKVRCGILKWTPANEMTDTKRSELRACKEAEGSQEMRGCASFRESLQYKRFADMTPYDLRRMDECRALGF